MLAENKRNAIIGVVGGTALLMAAGATTQATGSEVAGPLMSLAGIGGVVWSCTQLAKAKGYSPVWGALGIFTYFGLLLLLFMPDRSASDSQLSARDEKYLFPSDRNGLPSAQGPGAGAALAPVTHQVKFGGAFSIDGFDFVRSGAVTVGDSGVRYEGNQKRSILARTGLAIVLLPFGLIPAYYVVNYLWTTRSSLLFPARSLLGVVRKDCTIEFSAPHPLTGKPKVSHFKLADTREAMEVEREIFRVMSAARGSRPGRQSQAA